MIHEAPLPLEIAPMGTAQDLTLLHPIGVQVHMVRQWHVSMITAAIEFSNFLVYDNLPI